MIAADAHDLSLSLSTKLENRLHTFPGIGTSVDVIAEEHHGVTVLNLIADLAKQVVKCRKIAVNVADGDSGHISYIAMMVEARVRPAPIKAARLVRRTTTRRQRVSRRRLNDDRTDVQPTREALWSPIIAPLF